MYISSPKEGLALIKAIDKGLPKKLESMIVACPPAPLLAYLKDNYGGKRIAIGAQDISAFPDSAHTGYTSALLVAASGATYSIIGHAERRVPVDAGGAGESGELIAHKVRTALDANLTPILCVGESERGGDGRHFGAIEQMVGAGLKRVSPNEIGKVVVAYEPVWAIGAAQAPEPRVVAEALLYIRKTLATLYGRERALKVKILYGGAVDSASAHDLLRKGAAGGFLVGRASVNPAEFIGIVRACQ